MSDDKQLSGMVVCEREPSPHWRDSHGGLRRAVRGAATYCVNPRPASPTPEQPAQDGEGHRKALRAATLEEAAQHFAQPELDDTNVKCRHVAHFLRRLAAGEKMTFDPAAAALAPPAQTQQGTCMIEVVWSRAVGVHEEEAYPGPCGSPLPCGRHPPPKDDATDQQGQHGGAQTQQGLSVEGVASLRSENAYLNARIERLGHAPSWATAWCCADCEAEDSGPRLNPDKQPSPSAAPAQEPESSKALRAAYVLPLDDYELVNLLWLILSTQASHCNGDWHCQIRWKLELAAGFSLTEATPYPTTLQQELDRVAARVGQSPNEPAVRAAVPPAQPASPEGALREALRQGFAIARNKATSSASGDGWSDRVYSSIHWSAAEEELEKAAAALAGQPAREEPINQCDGCRAGRPIDKNGNHRMGDGDYPNLQACQQHLYSPAQPAREDDQKALRAAALEEAGNQISWAVDLLDMYDRFLVSLGHPPEKVYSATHAAGKKRARDVLASIRALAGSPAGEGREGNQEQPWGKAAK